MEWFVREMRIWCDLPATRCYTWAADLVVMAGRIGHQH